MLSNLFNKVKVFINYRRQDSIGHAGRIYDDLAERFGEANVIKDIEKIEAGANYSEVIDRQIKESDFLLVIIGPSWLDISDNGKRRIEDPDDLVSKEIIIAFENKIPVIPVLVNGAKMPAKANLTESLKLLADINAIELSDSRWKYDVDRLIKRLSKNAGFTMDRKKWIIAAGLIALISVASYFLLFNKPGKPAVTDQDTTESAFTDKDTSANEPATNFNEQPKKPIDMVGAGFTANAFSQYIPALRFRNWQPQFVVIHHTVTPNFEQWHKTTGSKRLSAFANFLGIQNGWNSGPHLFVADDSIWVFNELEKPGIHSPSWNKISMGIELVGDFSTESVNPLVEQNAVEAVAAIFKKLKMVPNTSTIRFHSEDPKSPGKACPGRNFNKADFIAKVNNALKQT